MSTQLERMKQLLEEKKQKGTQRVLPKHATKSTGNASSKGFNSNKNGGAFDK